MKLFLKQRLFGSILCIVLLASAVPFAVRAQSGEKTDAAPKEEAKTAADSEEVTLTFEATVDERGLFVFQNDVIEYRKGGPYPDPSDVTVNGKPWEDLSKPFQLGFTPDYGKAAIVEKEGRGTIELFTMPTQIGLSIVDSEASSSPYKIAIAVKNQIKRPSPTPDQTSVLRRPTSSERKFRRLAPVSLPYQLIEIRNGLIQKVPGHIYPKEFDARMEELEKNMSEKRRRQTLLLRYLSNRTSLTEEQRKDVQMWENEGNPLKMMYEETTDGKEIPVTIRGGLGPADLLNRSLTHNSIEIEAIIDFAADFEIHENRITYNFSDGALEGKFPREVKINGQPWKNLFVPFNLGMTVDPQSVSDTSIETEFYRYSIFPRTAKVCVGIKNHGFREEYVKIKILLRRN